MSELRFLTAGESHGPCLTAILEGLPAGLVLDIEAINRDLARRQQGYGRGGRMKIEKDKAEILSGVRFGETLGGPITLRVVNRDFANWTDRMAAFGAPSGHSLTVSTGAGRPCPKALRARRNNIGKERSIFFITMTNIKPMEGKEVPSMGESKATTCWERRTGCNPDFGRSCLRSGCTA